MSPSTWRATGFGLVALALSATPVLASKGRSRPPAPSRPPVAHWTVEGYGVTAIDAEANGLEAAGKSIADYLAKHHPAIAWTPSPDYLRTRKFVTRVGDPWVEELERSGRMQGVRMQIELTASFLEDSQQLARQQRMEQRQRPLLFGLGGAVVALLVLAAYLRLEEATRGFYTGVLRLTAGGVLALAAFAHYTLA